MIFNEPIINDFKENGFTISKSPSNPKDGSPIDDLCHYELVPTNIKWSLAENFIRNKFCVEEKISIESDKVIRC